MSYEIQTSSYSSPSVQLDKNTLLKTFNKHFFDFMDDIIGVFPDNSVLLTARNSFETIKKANPTTIAKVWHKYIYVPYYSYIEQGDISYFLEKDYSGDLNKLSNQSRVLEMIDSIREPLKSMGDVNKSHSIKYIQNLCKISNLYSNENETM